MDFFLYSKKNNLVTNLRFKSFWDFFDNKEKHINGVTGIQWTDGKYNFIFDLNKDIIKYKAIDGNSNLKKWPVYEAFKKPVSLIDTELDDLD